MSKLYYFNWISLLFSIVIGSFFTLRAQEHIQFKNYTINDGLSQSSVSCVVQDKLGALWLGTQDGINRFNGKDFEIYSAAKGYDISNGYIIFSYIDSKGNIWFGTYNGLTKYNPVKVRFSSFELDSTRRIEIHSISEDKEGNLWIGSAFGKIFKFNPQTLSVQLIDDSTFSSSIIDIQTQKNTFLFVSEYEGILLSDSLFQHRRIIKPPISNKEDFAISGLIKSPNYEVVISTSEGVFYLNKKKNKLEKVQTLFSELKDVNVVDALYLSQDKIVVASENSGLYILTKANKEKVNIIHYTADIFQKGSLISNQLTGLYEDNQGVVWISSKRGLSSYNPNHIGFKGVGMARNLKHGLPSPDVWGFAESKDLQFLFIATDDGVSCYDRENHIFHHYGRNDPKGEDHTTLSIYVLSKYKLLVGCYDGLFQLTINPEKVNQYSFTKYTHKEDVPRGFDIAYTILPYKKQEYLIGTKAGVMLFNHTTGQFKYLANSPDKNTSLGPGPCRLIFQYKGKFYTSPSSGGLYLLEEKGGKLTATNQHDFSALNHISSDYFTDVFYSNKGIFWFGTMGDGLVKYNLKNNKVIKYDKSDGLANDVIYGVESIKDNPKYIWLSTNKGVIAMDTEKEVFYNFSEKDGLMSNEMNSGASFVSQNGKIYFGGILGYNYIQPSKAFYDNKKIKVYFSGIQIENQPIFPKKGGILSKNIAFTDHIYIPYERRSLKLRFFANVLSNPDRIQYKYVLSGEDNISENLGTTNKIRFSSLAPGRYELYIYARLINGEWNQFPAHLTIDVERPFWLTWWFYSILFVLVSLFVLFRVRRSIDNERRRQVRLEMKIAERTRELSKKNKEIENQTQQLLAKTKELEREKEKSERILDNVLPKETASQLKKDGRSAARNFKKVSIMFTDFVGFSKIAEKITAKELVMILDQHFRKFDEITAENQLEKIKTIGDAYMCAGGVPIRNKTHPIDTVLAAVQIKFYMLKHKAEQIQKGDPYWKLRIGINTGSVSAGVIGTKRYAYDIWGSSVNKAQRMEQFCDPETIAITQDTFDDVEPYFEYNKVGKVKMKSGSKVMMYEIISIKPELSVDGKGIKPNDAFEKLVNLHHYSKINYYKAERFILSKLKKELNPKLHYHSYDHSKDVTRQVERIAIEEGITDEDLFLLKSAASYHDAGFVEEYEKNEPVGARMAAEILPKFGYTKEHIQRIKELIFVTQIPHQPKNKLEKIICDADLDYLGRDDFHEISNRLRKELRDYGKIDSDRKWDQMQVGFFKLHKYFTDSSIQTRLPKKKQHLEEIKRRLNEDNYKD